MNGRPRFPGVSAFGPEPGRSGVERFPLQQLTHVSPRDLAYRELLGGTYTLVDQLYEGSIPQMTLRDSTTVDVVFERERVLSDHSRVDYASLTVERTHSDTQMSDRTT